MKLNKKGFTMIELLAVLVVLALISGIAITGTTRYLEKTREKAYEALEDTLYAATQNYIIDKGIVVPKWISDSDPQGRTFTSTELIDGGYIKELQDPASKEDGQCTGSVYVIRKASTTTKLDEYIYSVDLQCSGYVNSNKIYNG